MTGTTTQLDYDVAIIGAGAAGLTTAAAMAYEGLSVICLDSAFGFEAEQKGDTRTIALLQNSIYLLQNLKVWERCLPFAQPLETMKVVDDTGRFPPVSPSIFKASDLGKDPFGYNIPNDRLVSALADHGEQSKLIELHQTQQVTGIETLSDIARVTTSEGKDFRVSLIIGADGPRSKARTEAGISTTDWCYDQTAVAGWFSHTLPHNNTSTEFHRPSGPLVVVPMQGNKCGLVWVEAPAEADRLMGLDDKAFCVALEEATHKSLGSITELSRRSAFPLSGLTAQVFARGRTALVGHAAHVLPPIGAQGLNLGLRDAAMIANLAGLAHMRGEDPGSTDVMAQYDKFRRSDIMSRTFMVDMLNRSLLYGWFPPLQAIRGLGVKLLNNIPAFRKSVMKQGMAPQENLPPLMHAR